MSDLLLLVLVWLCLHLLLLCRAVGLHTPVVEGVYPGVGSWIDASGRRGDSVRSLALWCEALNDLLCLLGLRYDLTLHALLLVVHDQRCTNVRVHHHTLMHFLAFKHGIVFGCLLGLLCLLLLPIHFLVTLWLLEWSDGVVRDPVVSSYDDLLLAFLLVVAFLVDGGRYNLIRIHLILSRFDLFRVPIIRGIFIVTEANGGPLQVVRLLLRRIVERVLRIRQWRALLLVGVEGSGDSTWLSIYNNATVVVSHQALMRILLILNLEILI